MSDTPSTSPEPIPETTQPSGATVQQAQALLVAVGKYAVLAGEEWRTGAGAEIMDAYESLSGDDALKRYVNALAIAKQEGFDEGRMSALQPLNPND